MKGVEAFSAILVTGIMLTIVSSVYFWGLPLIEKNKDISTLENSESWIRELNDRIKYVANHGGRDRLRVTVPGTIKVSTLSNSITLETKTKGSIYAVGAKIPLSKNVCAGFSGTWGIDEPSTICVEPQQVEDHYLHKYELQFLTLQGIVQNYRLELTGKNAIGTEQSTIVMESKGSSVVSENGKETVKTFVEITIA